MLKQIAGKHDRMQARGWGKASRTSRRTRRALLAYLASRDTPTVSHAGASWPRATSA